MTTNTLKTALLLGGQNGLIIGMGLAVVMNFGSYFFSDKIALSMYSAQPVTETENPEIYRRVAPIVQSLIQRMDIPMPKLYVIPEESPNAFATGRNPDHASVAFTHGILTVMSDNELTGVIAHELGHVKHRDILIASVAATLAAGITMLARMAMWFGPRNDEDNRGGLVGGILMMILAPIAAMMIQMAISRSREFDADAAAAKYTGSPYPLIHGLQKLDSWSKRIPMDASPATAHMFIIAPFSGQSMMRLFSTHPPTEERIARLEAMR
jgi:heat shock protein HtpX